MLQIIQEVKEIFQNFIGDEEQSVMLIEDTLEEAPLLLKTYNILEEDEESPDIYLSFGDDFQDTRHYVEAVIERQREQLEQVNAELEKLDRPTLELFPENVLERNSASQNRLKELFRHIRKISEPERRVIWLFYPLKDVAREEVYADLFEYIARAVAADETGNTKLIVRDTPSRLLKERLECAPNNVKVFCYRPELDFQSVLKKTEELAKDKNAPAEERIQSVMLMAGVDVAEKRFDDALVKNERVLSHYRKTKQKQNESVVQNNIGDIHYIQGQYPEAQLNYEKAVTIAVEEKSQPLVLYQSINLGNSLFMQEKYDEAFVYYDSAEKLAEVNKILIQQIQALERIGDTKRAQSELDEAIEIYNKAADLCRENKYKLGLMSVLERLAAAYEENEDEEKHQETQKELEQVKDDLREIDPHLVKD